MSSRAVILLKSPPRDAATDTYVQQLISADYTPYFIEVLESGFSSEQKLEDVIRTGPSRGTAFVGVVITSSRAAEAWVQALSKVSQSGDWSETPFYVVGESTGRTLKQITISHPTNFSETLILGAAQAGKSDSLAQFVLADLPLRRSGGKLLYLTGDKNRDTFHRVMSENGVDVESLKVYETTAAGDLEEKVALTAQEIEKVEGRNKSTWLIFFAPSSSDFALPHLCKYFHFPSLTSSSDFAQDAQLMSANLGAIGPTTASFLHSERGFRVDAVPTKPTADQLVASIREFDSNEVAQGYF